MVPDERLPIPGSERELDPTHVRVGELDPGETVTLTVSLRRVGPPPGDAERVPRADWTSRHGADPADVEAVRRFAAASGLAVGPVSLAARTVAIEGPLSAVRDAFGVGFEGRFAARPGGRGYRARSGGLTVPAALAPAIVGVFGIDDRPQARPHIRFAAAAARTYTPVEVAAAYAFPAGTDGRGETVAIVELGGGYRESDLTTYFAGLGIPAPSVSAVAVDGGANDPGADTDADGEVMLDVEVIGAVAPGARILVLFAPNTDQGFLDAVAQAIHHDARPSVVSISWGSSEDGWTAQARTQMESTLTDAAALGVTVTVAAGDGGSGDGATDGAAHVDFPASAPHALACGGTRLELSGATITAETVWSTAGGGATGGGVSDTFGLPSYQSAAHVPARAGSTGATGRGVPDVAGDADPDSGYGIRVDGAEETIGGTSAVAPLWAGLIARCNESLGTPLGFLQPRLYPLLGTSAFHDVVSGSNGAYRAGPGWDACTGLGTPDGTALLAALRDPA